MHEKTRHLVDADLALALEMMRFVEAPGDDAVQAYEEYVNATAGLLEQGIALSGREVTALHDQTAKNFSRDGGGAAASN